MFPFFPPFFFIYSFDNLVSVSTFRLIQLYMLIAGRTKLPHSLPPPSFIGYSASLSFFSPWPETEIGLNLSAVRPCCCCSRRAFKLFLSFSKKFLCGNGDLRLWSYHFGWPLMTRPLFNSPHLVMNLLVAFDVSKKRRSICLKGFSTFLLHWTINFWSVLRAAMKTRMCSLLSWNEKVGGEPGHSCGFYLLFSCQFYYTTYTHTHTATPPLARQSGLVSRPVWTHRTRSSQLLLVFFSFVAPLHFSPRVFLLPDSLQNPPSSHRKSMKIAIRQGLAIRIIANASQSVCQCVVFYTWWLQTAVEGSKRKGEKEVTVLSSSANQP